MEQGTWGDVLVSKHKNLSLDTQQAHGKLGVAVFNCSLSTRETETDLRGAHWPASLVDSVSCIFTEEPCIKK